MTAPASKPPVREPAATLPAGDAFGRALSGKPLLALTQDAELVEILRKVGDPAHELHPAGSEVDFSAALLTHPAGVAVLDCSALTSAVTELARRLGTQFPELVLIVAGGLDEQTLLAAQIADGSVHRFLHKPLSEQRVRLFLEAAWRRYAEVHTLAPATMRAALAPKPRQRKGRWGMVLALAAVAAPVAWISLNPAGRAPRSTSARGPAPPAGATQEDSELESLLARADQALSAGSLTTPPGASAADLYRDALRRNARDPRALEGLQQVIGRLLGSAEVQLQQGNLDAAQALASQARAIDPQHPRVAFLFGEIGTAREHAVLEKARRAAVHGNVADALAVLDGAAQGPHRPLVDEARDALAQRQLDTRVSDYLGRARDALSRAQLIAPSEDNALFYIESARTLAPDDVRVVEAAHDLGVRLESEARQALEARNPDAAESWTAAAADAGADAEQVTALRAQIGELRVALSAEARTASGQRSLAEARGALARRDFAAVRHGLAEASAAGVDPAALASLTSDLKAAEQAAESAAQLADTWVNENTLTRTHYVAPKFPEVAQRRGIEGWVVLHFVVAVDGAVQGLTVAGAQPAGMFEQAALDAVAQWRYQPVERDGQPRSQRAQVRVRFKVQR